LMINDLDAGAGRFDEGTQYTVNTQLVNATLMNIADNPTDVQLPGSYDSTPLRRIPIIVTGNDFSTLYAPLIRDGRMEKFYWEPNRDDKVGIVEGIFGEDGLSRRQVEEFVDTFSNQSVDFFSALRSRIYDELILHYIHDIGLEKVSLQVVNSVDGPPKFKKPDFSLSHLIEMGRLMVGEQKRVENSHLVSEYNRGVKLNNTQYSPSTVTPPSPPVENISSNGSSKNSSNGSSNTNGYYRNYSDVQNSTNLVNSETVSQIQQIISQGYKIGIEYVDERRFRTGSWQSCPTSQINGQADAVETLQSCLIEHPGEYVRLFGVDPKAKKRILETIIQRPSK